MEKMENRKNEKIFEELDELPSGGRGVWKNEKIVEDLKKLKKGKIYGVSAETLWDRWHGGEHTRAWSWSIKKKIDEFYGKKVASVRNGKIVIDLREI